MIIFLSDASHFVFLLQINGEQLIGVADRVTLCNQRVGVKHSYRTIVVHAISKLFHFTFKVGAVNHAGSVPYTHEIKSLAVRIPAEICYARLECFGYIRLLSGIKVHNAQSVAVAFVTVAFHAQPSDRFSVGRELRISIITHVLVVFIHLAEILSLLSFDVIKIDVRIGRDGIFQSSLFTASISNLLRIVAPCQLLYAAKRFQRSFVRLSFQYVGFGSYFVSVKVGYERMRHCFYPFIPMLIHQIVYHHTRSLVEVGVQIDSTLSIFHLRDEKHLSTVGRELKSFDVSTFIIRQFLSFASVGIHFPYLVASACRAEVSYFATTFYPCRTAFIVGSSSKQSVARAVGIHHVDYLMAFVILHAVVRYGVCNFLSVGRNA